MTSYSPPSGGSGDVSSLTASVNSNTSAIAILNAMTGGNLAGAVDQSVYNPTITRRTALDAGYYAHAGDIDEHPDDNSQIAVGNINTGSTTEGASGQRICIMRATNESSAFGSPQTDLFETQVTAASTQWQPQICRLGDDLAIFWSQGRATADVGSFMTKLYTPTPSASNHGTDYEHFKLVQNTTTKALSFSTTLGTTPPSGHTFTIEHNGDDYHVYWQDAKRYSSTEIVLSATLLENTGTFSAAKKKEIIIYSEDDGATWEMSPINDYGEVDSVSQFEGCTLKPAQGGFRHILRNMNDGGGTESKDYLAAYAQSLAGGFTSPKFMDMNQHEQRPGTIQISDKICAFMTVDHRSNRNNLAIGFSDGGDLFAALRFSNDTDETDLVAYAKGKVLSSGKITIIYSVYPSGSTYAEKFEVVVFDPPTNTNLFLARSNELFEDEHSGDTDHTAVAGSSSITLTGRASALKCWAGRRGVDNVIWSLGGNPVFGGYAPVIYSFGNNGSQVLVKCQETASSSGLYGLYIDDVKIADVPDPTANNTFVYSYDRDERYIEIAGEVYFIDGAMYAFAGDGFRQGNAADANTLIVTAGTSDVFYSFPYSGKRPQTSELLENGVANIGDDYTIEQSGDNLFIKKNGTDFARFLGSNGKLTVYDDFQCSGDLLCDQQISALTDIVAGGDYEPDDVGVKFRSKAGTLSGVTTGTDLISDITLDDGVWLVYVGRDGSSDKGHCAVVTGRAAGGHINTLFEDTGVHAQLNLSGNALQVRSSDSSSRDIDYTILRLA